MEVNINWKTGVALGAITLATLLGFIGVITSASLSIIASAVLWGFSAIWFYLMDFMNWRFTDANQDPPPSTADQEQNGRRVLPKELFFSGMSAALGLAIIALGHANLPGIYLLVIALVLTGLISVARAGYSPDTVKSIIGMTALLCFLEFVGLWSALGDLLGTSIQTVNFASHSAARKFDEYSIRRFVLLRDADFLAFDEGTGKISEDVSKHQSFSKGKEIYVPDMSKKYDIGGIYYVPVTLKPDDGQHVAMTAAYLVEVDAIDWSRKSMYNDQPVSPISSVSGARSFFGQSSNTRTSANNRQSSSAKIKILNIGDYPFSLSAGQQTDWMKLSDNISSIELTSDSYSGDDDNAVYDFYVITDDGKTQYSANMSLESGKKFKFEAISDQNISLSTN